MFKCQRCDEITQPREKLHRVVKDRFKMLFPHRKKIYKYFDEEDMKMKWRDDPGGEGWQIKEEINLCKRCFVNWDAAVKADAELNARYAKKIRIPKERQRSTRYVDDEVGY